jgi:hypothetical protein
MAVYGLPEPFNFFIKLSISQSKALYTRRGTRAIDQFNKKIEALWPLLVVNLN